MDSKIAKLYRTELEHLRSFMTGESPRDNRKTNAWSVEKKNLVIQRNPICKTCDEKLTLENITREHVHPLCLGGFENPKNVIPMCSKCNAARNSVMSDAIGFVKSKAIKKRWPGNKRSVESFLVWANATINDDHHTVNHFPELNEAFTTYRGKNITRFPNTTTPRFAVIQGLYSSFKNKLTGFTSKTVSETKLAKEVQDTEQIDCVCGAKVRVKSFKHNHKEGSFRCPKCGHVLKHTSTSKLAKLNKKAESDKKITRKKSKEIGITEDNTPLISETGSFPLMERINSQRGLKLPREPSVMLNSICWLMSSDLDFEDWKELLEDFKNQSIVKPKKLGRTLMLLTCWFSKEDFTKQDLSKLKKELRGLEVDDLATIIESECKNHSAISDSDFENLSLYFDELRKINTMTIKGFNTSSGLKLPATPSALHHSIMWLKEEVLTSESFNDLKEKFECSEIIPKSRARYIISFIFRSFNDDVKIPINELFQSTKVDFLQIDIPDLCLKMFSKSKNYEKLGFVETNLQRVKYYFYRVSQQK